MPRVAVLAWFLAAAGCAVAPDPATVVRDLIAADDRGDIDAAVDSYTDDVVWRPSVGGEVRGKAAVRERYREMFAAFDVRLAVAIDSEVVRGGEAFVSGTTAGELVPRAEGRPIVVNDAFTATLRPDRGRWRIRELAWRPRT